MEELETSVSVGRKVCVGEVAKWDEDCVSCEVGKEERRLAVC